MMYPPSRRTFLKMAAGAAGLLLTGCARGATEQVASSILVNHLGYPLGAAKTCMFSAGTGSFSIANSTTASVVYRGTLTAGATDLGKYSVGDFSSVRQTGTYIARIGSTVSAPFPITRAPYDAAIQRAVSYFAVQRCGNSTTGYHSPCHLDDGKRTDNGKHQDVTGGWHDACDLRKWVDSTIYGMIGLTRLMDLLPATADREPIIQELRWGNQYFLKMQDPAGFLMDYCGGDDGNHFTDNAIGTSDDRPIHVEPCTLPAQFHFVAAQASLARNLASSDPNYAKACGAAGARCLQWCRTSRSITAAASISAAILACVEMHRTTGQSHYQDYASAYVRQLIALQVTSTKPVPAAQQGFFRAAGDNSQPYRDIQHGNLPLIALCQALERFGAAADGGTWLRALSLHAEHLTAMSELSAFGIVPYGLYEGSDPGGNRRVGSYWYRWFMKNHNDQPTSGDWWVGINANLASAGIGLSMASQLLKQPQLGSMAQRQLDWILGANSYNACTMIGVGRNQPHVYQAGAFTPPTPIIVGGVLNGIGGDENDLPYLQHGDWNTCEYWTPMTAYTMWLMAELQT